MLTPAAAKQIIVDGSGRLTREGIQLLNALIQVSVQTDIHTVTITDIVEQTAVDDGSTPRDFTRAIEDVFTLAQSSAERDFSPAIADAATLAQADPPRAPAEDLTMYLVWLDTPRPVPNF